MKKRTNLFKFVLLSVILFVMLSCATEQDNTCEDDKKDENWGAIISSSSCSPTQKGEAYLARGGFDYFKFVANEESSLVTVLGLTAGSWQAQWQDFHNAASTVRGSYAIGSGAEKTIFFFGSFLAYYTYMTGNLDNGEGAGTTAFDGNFESSEISYFTGAEVATGSGGDGTTLVTTTDYQFQVDGNYYIYDEPNSEFYYDENADGLRDNGTAVSNAALLTSFVDTSKWTVLNQVVHMDSLEDPLASQGGAEAATRVTGFFTNLIGYLTDVEDAMRSLGIDSSDDSIEQITVLRSKIDNGGQCTQLDNNPSLRLVEMFAANSQKAEITSGGSYAAVNVFSAAELISLGENATFESVDGITVDPGVKMLFKPDAGDYIPYWNGAVADVKTAMESLDQFDPSALKADDGVIVLSEVICVSEKMSEE